VVVEHDLTVHRIGGRGAHLQREGARAPVPNDDQLRFAQAPRGAQRVANGVGGVEDAARELARRVAHADARGLRGAPGHHARDARAVAGKGVSAR
jgi:hypothetical protein